MKNDDLKNIFDYIKIPRDKIINFEINQSYDSVPTMSIEAVYEPSILVKAKSNNIEISCSGIKLTSSVVDNINSNTITVSERIDKLDKKMKEWKGDNMGKIDNILERYKKYQIEKIDMEKDNDIEFVRKTSQIGQLAEKLQKQAEKELKKLYPDRKNAQKLIAIFFENTDETQEAIEKIIEDRNNQIGNLERKLDDIKALIAIAETFEQKMEILKNYNIIDEEGKINIYE